MKQMPVKEVLSDSMDTMHPDTTRSGIRAEAPAAIRGLWWKALCGLLMSAAVVCGLAVVGPARGFTLGGHGGKIILFHVPCAWLASLAYGLAAWYAARYLIYLGAQQRGPADSTRDAAGLRRGAWAVLAIAVLLAIALFRMKSVFWSALTLGLLAAGVLAWTKDRPRADADWKCVAAMELGFLFSVLTTVTGSIFSHNEWNSYWSWDPRQTSILIIMLIFAAYLVLRGAVPDPDRRARLSAVYTLVAVVPGLFLIWVLPRVIETLHGGANQTLVGGQIGGNYRLVMYGLALPAFLMLYTWLFQLRLRLFKLEERQSS